MENSSDAALLRLWRDGDGVAGRALFDRLFPPLRRFFASKVDTGVDDLIQTTLTIAVEKSDQLRDDESFRPYVFTIARHELYRVLRTRPRTPESLDARTMSIAAICTSPSVAVQKRRDKSLLVRALRQIPLELQITLELHYWEGMKAREIAEVLDVPTSTITTRLSRARSHLAKQLSHFEGTHDDDDDDASRELREWASGTRRLADDDPS